MGKWKFSGGFSGYERKQAIEQSRGGLQKYKYGNAIFKQTLAMAGVPGSGGVSRFQGEHHGNRNITKIRHNYPTLGRNEVLHSKISIKKQTPHNTSDQWNVSTTKKEKTHNFAISQNKLSLPS